MKCTRTIRALATSCFAAIVTASVALAGNVIHVPANFATIQSAIESAANGDEIIVAPGTYHEAINFLGKAITVKSSDGRDVTTISALTLEQPVSVITFASGEGRDSVLDGFTITGGSGTHANNFRRGGGIYIAMSAPTIRHCTITENSAQYGSGIQAHLNSDPLISDCDIVANIAEEVAFTGGGGIMISGSTAHILRCSFVGNDADAGGGLIVTLNQANGEVFVEDCEFTNNTSLLMIYGGGVNVNNNALARFKNCAFNDNSGYGAYVLPPTQSNMPVSAVFENCTFVEESDGAIFTGANLTVIDSIFADNNGGGIIGGGLTSTAHTVTIVNSQFHNNVIAVSNDAPSSTLTITDSEFVGNSNCAVALTRGNSTLKGCTFIGNTSTTALGGGAVRRMSTAIALIDDCYFANNAAPTGGAVFTNSYIVIRNSTFEDNVASIGGGAIGMSHGTVENCVILGNHAPSPSGGGGGLLKNGSGTVTVLGTFFEGNVATGGGGGGIRHEGGTLTITSSSIVNNTATTGGGAQNASTSGALRFASTVFCDNSPENIDGSWTDLGGNSFSDDCIECAPEPAADLNCDGVVGIADLLILLGAWGPCDVCAPGSCPADLSGDCNVGVADLLLLLANWG